MSLEFLFRLLGMAIFAIIGARVGVDLAEQLSLPNSSAALIFGMVGILFGLVLTPWLTLRPVRALRRMVNELPIEALTMTLIGSFLGLALGLLLAYPLSLLGGFPGAILPAVISIVSTYLLATTFALRSRELWDALILRAFPNRARLLSMQSSRQVVVDTSSLIDGRIVGIVQAGFLNGTVVIPRFVLSELRNIADSSDMLRRNRGRRGLNKLNDLQRSEMIAVRIVEDDFDDIPQVDDKLVALALQMEASIITNDYNLNKVASAQGVLVLNVNALANEVKTVYIPGEAFHIHVIQEGQQANQGVGYLDDGTMVVVENGRQHMDRTIKVIVTRLIRRDTGTIIFTAPEGDRRSLVIHSEDDPDDEMLQDEEQQP
jgi:uncharacterized protein YacL